MAWFKLDDSAYDHPKIAVLTDSAFRLWVSAGLYSSRHLTDGVVTAVTLRLLQARPKACQELVMSGLWETIPDGGYRFHDWDHYQPTREQVQERRRRAAEKKSEQRSKANRNPQTGMFA